MVGPGPSRRAGFTLVEALAALAVVAIVLPVAMQGISLALKVGSDARRRAEAATLAQGKLDELAATGAWQTGQLTGDFGPEWPAYTWVATVQAWTDGSMDQLDVEVDWTARRVQWSVVVSTLVNPATAPVPGTATAPPAPITSEPPGPNP